MGALINAVVVAVVGGAVGSAAVFGLIQSQTQTPEVNPASQEMFVYGDR